MRRRFRTKSGRIIFLILIISFAFQLVGCKSASPVPKTVQAKLYYANESNDALVYETRTVSFQQEKDKYKAVLQELMKGPRSTELRRNMPIKTQVLSTSLEGTDMTVDLSRDFLSFGGVMAEIMAVGSVVNTMIDLGGVKRVQLKIDGKDYIGPSGQPRGFMTRFENVPVSKTFNVYFANKNANKVVAEKRTLNVSGDASREAILQELVKEIIKGPEMPEHFRTIPAEARVKSVKVAENVAWVDFSQEMISKHWRGAAGESMTINSIVNTLTEVAGIEKVGITVEGQPLAIEHLILTEPVERNPAMIW